MAKGKVKSVYVCQNCGAQRGRWEGRCSDCNQWNTFVEETITKETPSTARQKGWSPAVNQEASKIISLDQQLEAHDFERYSTGFNELNRVLGGGLVQGSFILLGGDPGIGKSTLLLQMAGGLAKSGVSVLYVSGGESVSQRSERAHV